ncbi:calponin homology domain-containing protein DDB_G0272472-like isoform X6 [Mya arenaria]|uniref:calponin homology domain-containing protein DDB_G0272472-like isoform X6 n=1 Tax=Mya arenaria TaxID=6604 RepID=UPI0022E1B76C|nr:calponin homology domain-containing protein DDB_G0272472-like isoform X6 [Mya arenaria]
MSANTLSPLSRGYGSWTAGYVDPYFGDKQHEHEHETLLPDIDHQSHVHGITVGSRSGRSTAMSYAPTRRSREPTSDGIPLPRTLTTRKGALQIYVAPDDLEDIEGVGLAGDGDGLELRPKYVQVRHPHGKELIDLSLKLGTMERLALSVLQFGDQEYDHEHTSVSDAKNKSFLKFLRSIDGEMPKKSSVDAHLRPGGDLNAYLRDLQSSASSRHPSDGSTYLPKSRESAELQALLRGLDTSGWPHTYGQDGSIGGHGGQFTRPVSRVSSRGGTSPGPPSTPRSSYQVLSAKKLVSSIKSGGYLGRPGSSFSANDDEINTGDSPQHVSSASVSHREWTPTDSTDNQLLDARHSFFCGLEEGDSDSDGKKRMGPREISFNSGLYPVDEERLSEIRSYKSSKKGRSWKSVSGVEESEDYIDEESRNSSGSLVYKLPTLGSDLLAEQKDDSSDDLDRTMLETQAGFSGTSGSYSDLLASNLNSLSAHSSRHTSAGVSGPSSVGRSPFASRPVSANTSMDQENQYQSTLQPLSADVTPMFLSRPATAASSRKASQVSSRPESAKLSSPIPMTSIISRHDSNGSVDDINEYIANDADVVDQSVDNIEVRMIQETDSHSGMEHKEKDEHLDIDCVQETNNKIDVDETNEEAEQSNTHMGRDESATVLEDSSEQTVNNIQTSKKIADVPDSKVLISNIEKKQGATTTPSEMQTVSPAAKQLTTAAVRRPLVQKPNNVAQHKPALAHKNKTVQQSKVVKGMPSQKGRKESVGNHGAKPVAISGKSELRETTLHGESEEVTVHGKSNLGKEGVSKKGLGEGPKGAQGEVDTVEASLGDWEHDSKLLDDQLEDAHNIAAELDTLGLRKTAEKPKKGKKEGYTFPLATGRRPKAPQEKAKIPDHLADALSRRPGTSYSKLEEDLEKKGFLRDGKVTSLVGETLSGPTLEAVGEGLTEEELEMAKLILQQKLDEAKGMISGESKEKTGKAVVKKKAPSGKGGKKGGKKKGGADLEEKSSEELEREAIRAKHAEEKELRDEEAANLQRQIAEKRHMLETQSNLTAEKSKELQEKMAELERQAEDLMRAEDEARTILAEVRRKQREERDARRKADLERKRQEAQDRREREKREAEEKASREREMIEKMQDVEMRKLKREEEERRAAEEERLAQERYEAELAENARLEEEQEDRMKELERQAEEEAMMRLVEEREAAERERRRLREQEEALQEHERLKMEALAEEQYKLEAERRRLEDAEQAKRDTERQRLMELRNLEEEARLQMQEEIERRRTDAFTRRDFNLENRSHVDRLKHNQGLTRAWTFSYFVHWPRETYERPIGDPDPRKVVKIKNPMPKKVDPSTEEEQAALAPPNPT